MPQTQRNWQPFRKALAEAAAAAGKHSLPDPWRLDVLQAGALLAGARTSRPTKPAARPWNCCGPLKTKIPRPPALLQALPLVFERCGCPADADRALAKLGKLPGQAFPAMLCRFQLCMLRKQYAQARDTLQAGLKSLPSQQFPLRLALSWVSMAEGRSAQAFQELVELQAKFPDNPQLLRQLVEMAWDLGKSEEC